MIKVYIGKISNFSRIHLLYPNLGFQTKETLLFSDKAFKHLKGPYVELEDDPSRADFLLIPHNYFHIQSDKDYIEHFVSVSKKTGKKIVVFAYGDSDKKIDIPNSIVFRTSQYRRQKNDNEIMMPAFVEDLADGYEFPSRIKHSDKPVIGFCGWAGLNNLKSLIKFYAKNLFHFGVKKQGLWFRRKAIKILSGSGLVEANFIARKSYSGHKKTIELPPEKARLEYVKNTADSDFILTVKGDGNFSFRFYEALSAGRIPFFIDTECLLPLDDIIDYKKFTLFADYKDLKTIDRIASDFYRGISPEKFLSMQKAAREAFEKYLRADKFFEIMFLGGKILEYV